jgi:hypothetical protein
MSRCFTLVLLGVAIVILGLEPLLFIGSTRHTVVLLEVVLVILGLEPLLFIGSTRLVRDDV